MKKRTIHQVLRRKFNDFLESIEDEELRKKVSNGSIITGGSIASMLMGEKVNDFDIYFKSMELAGNVANYYVEKFKKICEAQQHFDGREIDINVIEHEGRISIKVQSAGIAAVGGTKDYMYFETLPEERQEQEAAAFLEGIAKTTEKISELPAYSPIFLSENAITLRDNIQLIVRFYGEPKDIHSTYDFVHCCNFWTSWDDKLILNQEALESILGKNLIYKGSKYPICSIIRTRKFIARGWTITAGEYLKMAWQVSELNLKDISVLRDQLVGVDSAYFAALIHALQTKMESDPNFVISGNYVAQLVDRIFG